VKIGWLADGVGTPYGAELDCSAWLEQKPDWAEVVHCPAWKRPPADVEAFVVHNCVRYDSRWIGAFGDRPVVKFVHDAWITGSPVLRRWLLDNCSLLMFYSPAQFEELAYSCDAGKVVYVPAAVDLQRFRDAALPSDERRGNVFVGRLDPAKGVTAAIDWALVNGEPLDIYGDGPAAGHIGRDSLPGGIRFWGRVDYGAVPGILGGAKRFIFLPLVQEPYGRAFVEAWAAGCELVVNGAIGALWWMEHDRDGIARSGELFWGGIKEALC